MALIAEDLLQLLVDDTTGRVVVDSTKLDRALAGALLAELALAERIGPLAPQSGGWTSIVVIDHGPTGDSLLDGALARLAAYGRPLPAAKAVEVLVKDLRFVLMHRLVGAGYLRVESRTVLGIFSTVRWPALRPEREGWVRAGLWATLVRGEAPTARSASLISLLESVGAVAHAVWAPDWKAVVECRAQAVAREHWAGEAVRKAVARKVAEAAALCTVAAV